MTSAAGLQLSSSELCLPLPESRELWLAPSAIEWRNTYLRLRSHQPDRLPSVLDLVADPSKTRQLPRILDLEVAQLAQIYSISSLVREFKQAQSIFSMRESTLTKETVIADESQEKRLAQILCTVRIAHESSKSGESVIWSMLRELTSTHLHASFDQIELFAGREGPEEARTAQPILRTWIQSQSARQAAWHAGQVLRHMRAITPSSLHPFHAVACYHASLCLWIYGTFSDLSISSTALANSTTFGVGGVLLDGEETLATQRWISLNTGTPMISKNLIRSESAPMNDRISLNLTRTLMEVVVDIVRKKFQSRLDVLPLLVDNICLLIRTIGMMEYHGRYGTPTT